MEYAGNYVLTSDDSLHGTFKSAYQISGPSADWCYGTQEHNP